MANVELSKAMNKIPDNIYAEMADMVLMSWEELQVGVMNIQVELQFEEKLDTMRLARALDLVLDAQPVLGCRAVKTSKRMVWQRLAVDQRKNLTVTSSDSEYADFKLRKLDATVGPLVQGCLLRTEEKDILLLKVAHHVADAGGVKEVTEDIASIYTRLGNEPDFIPEPNLNGCRDWTQVYRRIPFYAYPRMFVNFLRETWSNMVPFASKTLQLAAESNTSISYMVRHLPAERVSRLSAYGKCRGATLNDMIATAFLRVVAAACGSACRGHLRLLMTIDLRRWHLKGNRAEGICNLSAFETVSLKRNPGRDFDESLSRVSAFTRARKANWPGLNQYFYLPLYYRLSYRGLVRFFEVVMKFSLRRGNFPNTLTNMGLLQPASIAFGGIVPEAAWILVPPVYPPMFGVGLSGYAGTLTLSAGVPSQIAPDVDEFFDKLLSELPA